LAGESIEEFIAVRIRKVLAVQEHGKKEYLVLECTACNRYFLAVSENRTRTCPYCGKRVKVEKARIASRSDKAEEARLILQKLKMKEVEPSVNEMFR
jgi:DNA-directed RNA polymerase subunit RPC12/RpoP